MYGFCGISAGIGFLAWLVLVVDLILLGVWLFQKISSDKTSRITDVEHNGAKE